MKHQQIAVLLTCHNRKEKTLECLTSLFEAKLPPGCQLEVFLTDDGSTDGTGDAVRELFPQINVLKGNGELFWAGGMRFAWKTAMQKKPYDAYLLINDDVRLYSDFMVNLLRTEEHSLVQTGLKGIYSGATIDKKRSVSYGGSSIKGNPFKVALEMLTPDELPKKCEVTNANILWVSKEVVDKIGIFDNRYTHGIADYDYSLQAHKMDIPVYLASNVCGICENDHRKTWTSPNLPLKDRIAYLKNPKGLAYKEYMYYIKRHFPLFVPYSFVMLWLKTFFPFFWDQFKKTDIQ